MVFAGQAAVTDILTGGRFEFAISRGHALVFPKASIPLEESRGRFVESLEIIEKAFEEVFSYHGDYYNVDNVRVVPRPTTKPKIYTGGASNHNYELAGKKGGARMQTLDIRRASTESVNENPFHLPDKQFFDWCTTNYFINRGVFNVIDSWFYDYGMKDIIKRRKVMVQYLKYLRTNGFYNEKKLFLQFGKGGVKESLYFFTDERYRNSKGDFIENSS